eukprot:366561-Chlamydomonas_euryale.AAC.19
MLERLAVSWQPSTLAPAAGREYVNALAARLCQLQPTAHPAPVTVYEHAICTYIDACARLRLSPPDRDGLAGTARGMEVRWHAGGQPWLHSMCTHGGHDKQPGGRPAMWLAGWPCAFRCAPLLHAAPRGLEGPRSGYPLPKP